MDTGIIKQKQIPQFTRDDIMMLGTHDFTEEELIEGIKQEIITINQKIATDKELKNQIISAEIQDKFIKRALSRMNPAIYPPQKKMWNQMKREGQKQPTQKQFRLLKGLI